MSYIITGIIGIIVGFLLTNFMKGSNPDDYDKGYMDGWDNCDNIRNQEK